MYILYILDLIFIRIYFNIYSIKITNKITISLGVFTMYTMKCLYYVDYNFTGPIFIYPMFIKNDAIFKC